MKKMNMFLKAAFMVPCLIMVSSCTIKYMPPVDPQPQEGGRYMFMASIEDIPWTEPHVWSASEDAAGIYAGNGYNCKYVLRKSYDACTGQVQIYGPEVTGEAYAYFPYDAAGIPSLSGGRIVIPQHQNYCIGAYHALSSQSVRVGYCENDAVSLRYMAGVLTVSLKVDFESGVDEAVLTCKQDICGNLDVSGLAEQRLTEASNSISMPISGLPCSEDDPLQLSFVLPAGEYTEIYVTVNGVGESVTANVKTTEAVVVEDSRETRVVAEVSAQEHDYSGSDFEEEIVHFD